MSRSRRSVPSGVTAIWGTFETGDAVCCMSPIGREIARGLTNYSASEMMKIKGRRSTEIEALLGYKGADEVVHRDNLVIFK